jgi:uncharacterized protein
MRPLPYRTALVTARIRWQHRVAALVVIALVGAIAWPVAAQPLYDDLIFAATNDRAEQARSLLARGLDPDTVDPNGDPVLVIAARAGNAATVDVLLAGRAKVNARNRYGDTAIMAAALNGHLGIVRKLGAQGAALDYPGWTPLIYAATGGHDEIVRFLLGEGANVDAGSPNGTTALMMAVREGRVSTVELLLARGANANLRNENGVGALDWAKRNDDTSMVEKLRRAGARD